MSEREPTPLSPAAQAILTSVQRPVPSEEQREAVWQGLASVIGTPVVHVPSAAPAAQAIKLVALGFLAGVAVDQVWWAITSGNTPAPPLSQASIPVPHEAPASLAPAIVNLAPIDDHPSAVDSGVPRAASLKLRAAPFSANVEMPGRQALERSDDSSGKTLPTKVNESPSDLSAQRQVLETARQALVRRDAETALTSLREAHARWPTSVLAEEREALEIQALLASGQREEAEAALRRFEQRYPDGILVPALRQAAGFEPQ
jgi:hypothetical protein